ncbi:hypothetical protein QZH41_007076 [Actinostola sp. cb2023]|nr:hypothetical protein QZH41_007076 [Actinostola sp. cb2023]
MADDMEESSNIDSEEDDELSEAGSRELERKIAVSRYFLQPFLTRKRRSKSLKTDQRHYKYIKSSNSVAVLRYRALVYPFKIRWAGKFCFMVCAIYAVSIAVVTPYILVLLLSKNGDKFDCIEKWPNPQKKFRQAYTIVLFLLQYALPLVLMITLYSITLRSLFNNNKSFPGMKAGAGEKEPSSNESHPEAEKRTNTLKELRKEQHLKVTKMFITVVIVFAISMFPNQVFWLWVDFGNLSVKYHFSITSIICRIFTYSNSVLNPFIYGLYSKEFRKGYKKAGRRVHRQTPFYYTQTKKAGHLGTPTTSLLESRTKLIPTANTNGITLEPIDTKRVQFCSEKDEKTKRDEESLKEIHLSNDETQKDSNIIKDSGNGLDFNSNSKRTTFDDADEKENTQSELIEDIYNSINSQTPMKCDDLDERVVEYFGELQETSC